MGSWQVLEEAKRKVAMLEQQTGEAHAVNRDRNLRGMGSLCTLSPTNIPPHRGSLQEETDLPGTPAGAMLVGGRVSDSEFPKWLFPLVSLSAEVPSRHPKQNGTGSPGPAALELG